jgi:Zn-dependent protease
MNKHTLSMGKIIGIPIGIDYSWFLVFILFTWVFASSYYPSEFQNWSTAEYWIVGAATTVMLFVSVLLHELSHSIVARRYKIQVRRITLFIFGGVSEITSEASNARAEFWIAIAGPLMSAALAGLFAIVSPIVKSITPLYALTKYLAYINISLAIFNLIPGFPLDGGRVFRSIIWGANRNLRRATVIAANVGRFIAFGFILFGVWLALTGNLLSGIWIAFIGWFLESAASSQLQQQRVERLLNGHRVSEAMVRNYTAVPADVTLQRLVDEHILGSGRRSFVVEKDHHAVGLLTIHQIKEVPQSEWSTTRVDSAMLPLEKARIVRPSTDLEEAVKEMDSDGVNQLPVMEDGHLVGTLNRESVISFLRTLSELGY